MKRAGIPRRLFLGGASVMLTLPFLESLLPRVAHGQSLTAPQRLITYYVPNGIHMPDWTPEAEGTDWDTPLILEPLRPHKAQTLVLTGLVNEKQDEVLGDHAGGTGSFLTARTVRKNRTKMEGPSIDQLIAAEIGQKTKLPSFELGGQEGGPAGTCDSGYACAFTNQISFDLSGTPLPKLSNPARAFDRLFEGFDPNASASEAARRDALRKSALDIVLGEANSLAAKVSKQDRERLDEYMTAVRELERRIANQGGAAGCKLPTRPDEGGDQELMDSMTELMALALQCDATRVISYMWGNAVSDRNYGFIGAAGAHHEISHHGQSSGNIERLKKIDRWEVEQLEKLVARLKGMSDVDGRSVLDNTLIFFSSDVSDGDRHNHDDMPVLLVGGAGGFSMGRHVIYEDRRYFGNLFVSIANGFGVPVKEFGERGAAALERLKA